YTVSGVPVVTDDLATTITGGVAGLLAAAVVVMAVVLLLVFRSRLRLLPLLIGLAVDYAVQFQARAQEGAHDVVQATIGAAPTIATAALATAAGFLALL